MSPISALLTLYADYIGGKMANYRKRYFAVRLDLNDAVGHIQNTGLIISYLLGRSSASSIMRKCLRFVFKYAYDYDCQTIHPLKLGKCPALTRSATTLGGAVATVIMILATLAEFCTSPQPGRAMHLYRCDSSELSVFHGRLSDPTFSSGPGERLFMACIRLQIL
jgi:hypothetical protein